MKLVLRALLAAALVVGLGAPSRTHAQTEEATPPEPGMEFPEEGTDQGVQGDMEMPPDDGIELTPDEMMPADGMAMPPDEMPPDEQTDGD